MSAVWENRCKVIHGKDQEEKYSKTRETLIITIQQIHKNSTEVGASERHLFSQEESTCASSIRNMKLWVKLVKL